MARGSYIGGSTIIGAGRSWSFDPDFDFRVTTTKKSANKRKVEKPRLAQPRRATAAIMVCGKPVTKKTIKRHRAATHAGLNRDVVLAGIDRPMPVKLPDRAAHLKQLVIDGILLQTGAVNAAHPQVAQWVAANPTEATTPVKKKKKHDHR